MQSNPRSEICRKTLSHLRNADRWQWKQDVSKSKLWTCVWMFSAPRPHSLTHSGSYCKWC